MRRRATLAMIGLLAGGPLAGHGARAGDEAPGRAAVRVVTARTTRFVGEPIDVRLEVDYDADWLKEHGVPMFLRPVDVPLRVSCPGLPAGTATEEAAGERATLALDDGVVDGRVTAGSAPGRVVLVLDRVGTAAAPGELVIGPPKVAFAYATRFRDDLVNGRVAVDRTEAAVGGEAVTIRVEELPQDGRPPEFEGAIGRFDVTASVDATTVEVGQLVHLTLRIAADGPSSIPSAPRLDGLRGFHVFGARDDAKAPGRTIVYDVAVTEAGVREVPSIAFASFDPEPPAGYRVVRTPAIPLVVRGAAGPASPATVAPAARDGDRGDGGLPGGALAWGAGVLVLAGVAVGLGWARRVRRARERAEVEMARAAVMAAAARYHERVARSGEEAADAFAEFLAARMGRPLAWVISPDLRSRLLEAGVEVSLATRAAATMEGLVAGRYGGGAPDLEEAAAIVDVFDLGLNAR